MANKNIGNPNGAGRYRFTRSSAYLEDMLFDEEATFDSRSHRWVEHIGCGYDCSRDGEAFLEADTLDLGTFHRANPQMETLESYYELEYGNTRTVAARVFFCLTEYRYRQFRSFSFRLYNAPMRLVNQFIAAVEEWHHTRELTVGAFCTCPCDGPWEKFIVDENDNDFDDDDFA